MVRGITFVILKMRWRWLHLLGGTLQYNLKSVNRIFLAYSIPPNIAVPHGIPLSEGIDIKKVVADELPKCPQRGYSPRNTWSFPGPRRAKSPTWSCLRFRLLQEALYVRVPLGGKCK